MPFTRTTCPSSIGRWKTRRRWRNCKARWPFARFPILVDDGRTIVESTIIIEHLMLKHGGRVRWLPADPLDALEVRFLDRFFDNDVMSAMQKPVFEALRNNNARQG